MKPLLATVLLLLSTLGIAQQKRVVYENDQIRVVVVTYGPGEKTAVEPHADALAITLSDFQGKKTANNGSGQETVAKAGQMNPVGGIFGVENTGSSASDVMYVEFKNNVAAAAAGQSIRSFGSNAAQQAPMSRIAANEASATATLRTLNTAQVVYASTYNRGFSDGLGRLGMGGATQPDESHADLVDPTLSGRGPEGTNLSFIKNGYRFTYTPIGTFGTIARYTITAEPMEHGVSGTRHFFTDQSAVVRAISDNRPPNVGDNPI